MLASLKYVVCKRTFLSLWIGSLGVNSVELFTIKITIILERGYTPEFSPLKTVERKFNGGI